MRLQEYVSKSRSTKIDILKAAEGIKTKCRNAHSAFINGNRILRGVRVIKDDFLFTSPSKFERQSANANNLYTMIMDNSSIWEPYPDRSKSIICTTDFQSARGFGTPYYIFPVDGSNIGICPRADLWASFHKTIGRNLLLDMSDDVEFLLKKSGIGRMGDVKSYQDVVSVLRKLDIWLAMDDDNMRILSKTFFSSSQVEYNGDMLDTLKKMLDPNKNGFKVTNNINAIDFKSDHELWTDGDSYMIKMDVYNAHPDLLD